MTVSMSVVTIASCCPRACIATLAFRCGQEMGGGCCSFGSTCVAGGSCASTITNTPETTTFAPVITTAGAATKIGEGGLSTETANTSARRGRGLSIGAKVGIGVSVAGLALLILGLVLYFCVAKRRAFRLQKNSGDRRISAPTMSQSSNSAAGAGKHLSGYFGPVAAVGPFTDVSREDGSKEEMVAVPLSPHTPNDIAVPVELDGETVSVLPSPSPSPGDEGLRLTWTATSPAEMR